MFQRQQPNRIANRTLDGMVENLGKQKDPRLNSALANVYAQRVAIHGNAQQMLGQSDEKLYEDAVHELDRQKFLNSSGSDAWHAAYINRYRTYTVRQMRLEDALELDPKDVLQKGEALLTNPYGHQMFIKELGFGKCVRFDANEPGMERAGPCRDLLQGFFGKSVALGKGLPADNSMLIANPKLSFAL